MSLVELFGEKLISKDGEVDTKDATAGKKNIMVYFSAHWCPPCRGFTPVLADAYKACATAGKDTMVIFVSSDKDQAAFDEYYATMPWHAVPLSAAGIKDSLSKKFGVSGIPMLMILDGEGNEVSKNGRAEYATYLPAGAPAAAAPAAPAVASPELIELFGSKLVSKDGEVDTGSVVAGKTNILVYFSAHWCPPCRGFTPELAKAYKACGKAGEDVVVIFASSDRDQAAFDEYYGEMPWHALPFSARDLKDKLSNKFGVQGIPMLVVLDGKGELVTAEGRGSYKKYLPAVGGGLDLNSNDGVGAGKAQCCVVS